MGAYIYRVTAKTVRLVDGNVAHVAQYAYKPSRSDDSQNHRWHFKSGCVASERLNLKSGLLVLLDELEDSGTLYENPHDLKWFYDDNIIGTKFMPLVGEIQRIAPGIFTVVRNGA